MALGEISQFVQPFGSQLAGQSAALANQGQSIQNQSNQLALMANTGAYNRNEAFLDAMAKEAIGAPPQPPQAPPPPPGFDPSTAAPAGPPKRQSIADKLEQQANQSEKFAQLAAKSGAVAQQEKYAKDAAEIRSKASSARAQEQKEKIENANMIGEAIGVVKDQTSLDSAVERLKTIPGGLDALPAMGFVKTPTGGYVFTPIGGEHAYVFGKTTMAMKDQMKAQLDIEEEARKKADLERQKLVDAQHMKKNDEDTALGRANLSLRGSELELNRGLRQDAKAVSTGTEIRKEQDKALKPIDDVQQNVTTAKQLLATSTPASDKQLQTQLTNIFDKTRATNLLFKENANFGSLAGRVEGFIGRAFTGQYTDNQRAQIKNMIDDMENNVLIPTRGRIEQHYGDIAKESGVPSGLVKTPDFYRDAPKNAQAEAEAYLNGLGNAKSR